MSNKGFTLIELIIFIIVGGILLPLAMIAFTSAMKGASTPDYMVKARFYAQQKMEELTKDRFDCVCINTGSCFPSCNTGSNIDTPETNYQRSWSICYVPSNNIGYANCDIASDTYYKKITVTVTPTGYTDNYAVSTIVTKRPKAP